MPYYAIKVRIPFSLRALRTLKNTQFAPKSFGSIVNVPLGKNGLVLSKTAPIRIRIHAPTPDLLKKFLNLLGYEIHPSCFSEVEKKYTRQQVQDPDWRNIPVIEVKRIPQNNPKPTNIANRPDRPNKSEGQKNATALKSSVPTSRKGTTSKYDSIRAILVILFFHKTEDEEMIFRPHFGKMRFTGFLNRYRHLNSTPITSEEAVKMGAEALGFLKNKWNLAGGDKPVNDPALERFARFVDLLKCKSECHDFCLFLEKCKKISSMICRDKSILEDFGPAHSQKSQG